MADDQANPSSALGPDSGGHSRGGAALDWADRSKYWLDEFSAKTTRRRREREQNPLFLTGNGLSLRVDKGSLLIRDGKTHYPADIREWRFFNGALDIPPAIVVVDGSGEITMDAIDWLSTQGVSLIRLRWDGQFVSVISNGGQAASTAKVRWQESTRLNPKKRLGFAVNLIREKAHYTVTTMENYVPRSDIWDKAYEDIAARAWALERRPPPNIQRLLGIEGMVANGYFRSWSVLSLKWKGLKKNPIPRDWQRYASRSALRESRSNRGATHPINAMLNYAYGVWMARRQIQLIADGYDPTLGILHDRRADRGSYPAFGLDYMEPMRPVVDRAVLQLVDAETFSGSDFSIQHDGVCRLNPQLARRVAQLALSHYAEVSNTEWLKQER